MLFRLRKANDFESILGVSSTGQFLRASKKEGLQREYPSHLDH